MLVIKKRSDLPGDCILNAPEQTVIVTVNIEGAMGRGVALSCKERYPDLYKKYYKVCKLGILQPNSLLVSSVSPDQQILLFPTKIKWREASPPELIIDNLKKLANMYDELNITSLAIPPLGMENGWLKGKWKELVYQCILDTFGNMDINCTLYK